MFKVPIKSLALFSALCFLTACGGSTDQENHATDQSYHEHGAEQQTVDQVMTGSATTDNSPKTNNDDLNTLIPLYFKLEEALVVEDIALAQKTALMIDEAAAPLKGSEKITEAAAKILTAEDIEVQRNAFYLMSKSLVALVKQYGLKNGTLYLAKCPMAFNDEGATWLTHKKQIRNPYFGNAMLTCGSIEEEIHQQD